MSGIKRIGVIKRSISILYVLLLLGFNLVLTSSVLSQDSGYKFFRNYSPKEYDHQAQNWGMAQAENGLLYVANQGGVLEYDGVSWRVIMIPNNVVRSLAICDSGVIYIGGNNEFGFLTSTENGSWKYESLLSQLEEQHRKFSQVWSVHATKNGIYFRASQYLFLWDSTKIITYEADPGKRFKSSFVRGEEFYVQEEDKGLLKVVNGSLALVSDSDLFKGDKLDLLLGYDGGDGPWRWLMGFRNEGIFLTDGKKRQPLNVRLNDYLKIRQVHNGAWLSTGELALGTLNGGLVIVNRSGDINHVFDKDYGLQDDNVRHSFEDNQGNLWICLNNGISKIEYISPISIFDGRANLPGIVLCVQRTHGDFYVGTSNGLHVYESLLTFRPVPGVVGSCRSLAWVGDTLLAATIHGIFLIKNKVVIRRISKIPSNVLLPSRYHGDIVWCGSTEGLLRLILKDGKWFVDQHVETQQMEIKSVAEENKNDVWLGTMTGNVFRVNFPVGNTSAIVAHFSPKHGLPADEIHVTAVANHVVFATRRGLFKFDVEKRRLIPDPLLGDEYKGQLDKEKEVKPVFRLVEDSRKNIWLHSYSRNYIAAPTKQETFEIISGPYARIPISQSNSIYPEPERRVTWFATQDGLVRYDTSVKKNYVKDFHTMLRKTLVNDRLIFNGGKSTVKGIGKDSESVFEYRDRNMQFEFAAPFFEAEDRTRFRYFLEGYDPGWSDWSDDTIRYYTNLDAGSYTFRVEAENVHGHSGTQASFRFKVLPPWYQTWWAILLYIAAALLAIYFYVKRRLDRLERAKQELEYKVEKRTQEIQKKNQQLQIQALKLKEQSEQLTEMDKIKSRFFANISHEFRTPLTLIMTPLEQMLIRRRDKQEKETMNVMLQKSRQLLALINQLLDLSRFDSGKIKLQASCQNIIPFIKGIFASFEMAAPKRGLKLESNLEETDIPVFFDAPKMEQALQNLLINAVKFTPTDGKIILSVSKCKKATRAGATGQGAGDVIEISVRDTGIGIPPNEIKYIFERFHQAESPHEDGLKGTGIGLAIAKEIVMLHHGNIDVHSQLDKGTEFVIRLPLGCEHLKEDEIVTTPEKLLQDRHLTDSIAEIDDAVGDTEDTGTEIPDPREDETEEETKKGEKIEVLVVEDNKDMRDFICRSLKPFFKVISANDGQEGIDKAKEIIPDLIVSDIRMPKKDGYELCRELKTDIRTSHIPIILLTARASAESELKGLETGAGDYITKPFNTPMLIRRIKNLIELRKQLQLNLQRRNMEMPDEIAVSSLDSKFLAKFQKIIEKNLSDEDFTMDVLQEKLGMSRASFYKKIKALTGKSPNKYLVAYRLDRGAQLLKEGYGNVTEVSGAVGFSSPAYFTKCFGDKFGVPPTEFREPQSKTT